MEERDGSLRIGALVRHNHLASNDIINARYPTIAAAAPQIADPLVRNLGTIGGSLTHADPSGDLGSVMLALGASVVLKSSTGEREVPIGEFLVDTFQSSIAPNELLTEIHVPRPAAKAGGTYLKLERKVGDYATVATAIYLELNNGSIGKAGIALTSVGLTNIKATAAEASLVGAAPSDEVFAEAGRLAAAASSPVADVRGAPSTSGTWSRCTCDAAWPARSRWPARPEPEETPTWKSRSTSTAPSGRPTWSLVSCSCT